MSDEARCEHGHLLTQANSFYGSAGVSCRECGRMTGLAYSCMVRLGLQDRSGKPRHPCDQLIEEGADNADRDKGRSLLSEAEGKATRRKCSRDLPEFNWTEPPNGKAAGKEKKSRILDKTLSGHTRALLIAPQPRFEGKVGKRTAENFVKTLEARMLIYRVDALEAIRDLAIMPISENSMQNQCKFLAASRLLGNSLDPPSPAAPTSSGAIDLQRLNDAYRVQSQKIMEVRERIVTYERPTIEVNGSAQD